jgi:hypothetical protein
MLRWFRNTATEGDKYREVSLGEPLPVQAPVNPLSGSAHVSNSVLSAAVTLAPPTGATRLLIQAFTKNVRYTLDGTVPTAALGFQIRAGDPPQIIPIGEHTTIKVIEEAASANIQYQWCI